MSGVFEAVTLPFAARGMGCDEFVRDAGMGGACVLRVTTIRKDCIYYQQQPVAERKVRLVIIPFKMMIENEKTCEVQEQSIQSINGPWLPRAPTLHSDARDASTTFHAFQQHVRRRRPRPQERGSHHLCHRLSYTTQPPLYIMPRAPLTTYAHRRRRAKAIREDRSSPMPALADNEDISLSDMVHRMKKRSRKMAFPQNEHLHLDEDCIAPVKKAKIPANPGIGAQTVAPVDLMTTATDDEDPEISRNVIQFSKYGILNSSPGGRTLQDWFDDVCPAEVQELSLDLTLQPITPQVPDIADCGSTSDYVRYCTPDPFRAEIAHVPLSGSKVSSADQLSPLPISRRMLSRPSSRTLKENKVASDNLPLASPFHSHPSSRATSRSPARKTSVKTPRRPRTHAKSRTLSGALTQKKINSIYSTNAPKSVMTSADDQHICMIQDSKEPKTGFHLRTASIPSLRQHSPEPWFVPAKNLIPVSDDAVGHEHVSFYFNVPNEVSTPPRRRHGTVSALKVCSAGESERSYLVGPGIDKGTDADMENYLSIHIPSSPRPVPVKKKTVVHLSSDSIFSSALDFSVSALAFDDDCSSASGSHSILEPTSMDLTDTIQPVSHENLIGSDLNFECNSGLAAAFSLVSTPALPHAPAVQFSRSDASHSSPPELSLPENEPYASPIIFAKPLQPQSANHPNPTLDNDYNELRDLFFGLGLDGNLSDVLEMWILLNICVICRPQKTRSGHTLTCHTPIHLDRVTLLPLQQGLSRVILLHQLLQRLAGTKRKSIGENAAIPYVHPILSDHHLQVNLTLPMSISMNHHRARRRVTHGVRDRAQSRSPASLLRARPSKTSEQNSGPKQISKGAEIIKSAARRSKCELMSLFSLMTARTRMTNFCCDQAKTPDVPRNMTSMADVVGSWTLDTCTELATLFSY